MYVVIIKSYSIIFNIYDHIMLQQLIHELIVKGFPLIPLLDDLGSPSPLENVYMSFSYTFHSPLSSSHFLPTSLFY